VATARPGVVILNAGVLHHVGPNRLHVQLARALAAEGFPVLRFDLSGIGDSPRQEGTEGFVASMLREVKEATEVLEANRGAKQFLLVGICSGADNGLRAAHNDSRVVGAALIDGYSVPSARYTIHEYRRRVLSARSWLRLIGGRSEVWGDLRRLLTRPSLEPATATRVESVLVSPRDYGAQMQALVERGAHVLLVYTGKGPAYFNYRRLFRKQLKGSSSGRVSVSHLEDADHVFTLLGSQRKLTHLVCEWATGLARIPRTPWDAGSSGSRAPDASQAHERG
jgi:pimeloyl-ACP methyl ester carboxylesterase